MMSSNAPLRDVPINTVPLMSTFDIYKRNIEYRKIIGFNARILAVHLFLTTSVDLRDIYQIMHLNVHLALKNPTFHITPRRTTYYTRMP